MTSKYVPAVFAGAPTLVATRNAVLASEDRCDSRAAVNFFIPDGRATSSFFFIIPAIRSSADGARFGRRFLKGASYEAPQSEEGPGP